MSFAYEDIGVAPRASLAKEMMLNSVENKMANVPNYYSLPPCIDDTVRIATVEN